MNANERQSARYEHREEENSEISLPSPPCLRGEIRQTRLRATVPYVLAFAWVTLATGNTRGLRAAEVDVGAVVARVTDCDSSGKHTAPPPDVVDQLCDQVLSGGPKAVSELIGMLREPDKGGDYKARYLLHALALNSTRKENVKARATVTQALIDGLQSQEGPNVRAYLIAELQFLHPRQAQEPIARFLLDQDLYDCACRALVAIGKESAPLLIEVLPKAKARNRMSIIQALGNLGVSDAVSPLISLLDDASVDIRLCAGAALAEIGDARAVEPMLKTLPGLDGHARVEMTDACFALAETLLAAGSREEAFGVYRAVWATLGNELQPHMHNAIVNGLAGSLEAQPTPALVKRLKGKEAATRAAALNVLGARADAAAFDAVAEAMKDPDSGVRLVAARVLPRLGGARGVPLLVATLPGDSPQAERVLRSALINVRGEGTEEALSKALTSVPSGPTATGVRLELLSVLAQRRAGKTAPAIFELTSDKDGAVRTAAYKTLARLGDGSYAGRLIPRLANVSGDEAGALENAILETCRRISGAKNQAKALADGLKEADVKSQVVLLRVAGLLGSDESAALLKQALNGTPPEVQDQAVRSLSEFPNDTPAETLLDIAKTTDNQKRQVLALRGYVRMSEKQRDEKARLAMLSEAMRTAKRVDEKRLVVGTIGKTRSPASLVLALSFLEDPEIAEEAGLTAVTIGDTLRDRHADQVRKAMDRVLATTKEEKVRKKAQELLKRLPK